VGESVLLEVYKQIGIIKGSPDQEKFKDGGSPEHVRVLYYAAALCALGDDGGASGLMDMYAGSVWQDPEQEPIDKSRQELIDTLTLFVNTTVDPVKAFNFLKDKEDNEYVSDVCEKVNFIRKAVPVGGTVSEVAYTLDGKERTARLEGFGYEMLTISKEQLDGLNLRRVNGNTSVRLSYNGNGADLEKGMESILVTKSIANKTYDRTISLIIKMPEHAPKGYYTAYDRVPTNMRYSNVPNRRAYTPDYHVSNPEGQTVVISFYYHGYESVIRISYNAIKVSDVMATIGPAYVSRVFATDEIWGASN